METIEVAAQSDGYMIDLVAAWRAHLADSSCTKGLPEWPMQHLLIQELEPEGCSSSPLGRYKSCLGKLGQDRLRGGDTYLRAQLGGIMD